MRKYLSLREREAALARVHEIKKSGAKYKEIDHLVATEFGVSDLTIRRLRTNYYPEKSTATLEKLLDYCRSNVEKQVMAVFVTGLSVRQTAEELGLPERQTRDAISRVKARAALQGFAPEHDMFHTAPETHIVKGVSTLYKDNQVLMQWVKTDKKGEEAARQLRELCEALKEDLPQYEPVPLPEINHHHDMLAVYPLGDPHAGMFAWLEETGEADFDLKIFERELCGVMDRLVDSAPPTETALIANLGDFFHADNLESTTSRSNHALDTDTRYPKVMRVGVRALRHLIHSALRKHQKVVLINAIGNHDDHLAMMLSVMLSHIYENEPRVEVIDSPRTKHYYRFGKVLIGVTHGHLIKMDDLPIQMAADRPEDWGATEFRYWYSGHIHHDSKKEHAWSAVVCESFRTLAPKDAYHAGRGYKSGRDAKVIVHHKDFGEVMRFTCSVDMFHLSKKSLLDGQTEESGA